jgi:chemotaxis protein CheD
MSASDALPAAASPLSRMALPRVVPAAGVVSRVEQLKARTPKPGEASFFFHDPHFRADAVKVLPGEYYVSADDLVVMTVLGSCIAACIWDPRVRVGGMNHFMLPEGGSDSGGRYGSYAMELLINELMKQGARRETMQAKVFGGGAVMSSFTTMNVGERNTKFVLDYLQTERIAVVSKDVLDVHPRKVCFFPATGKAMVKRLASSNTDALETQERKGNAATVVTSTAGGSIDLF